MPPGRKKSARCSGTRGSTRPRSTPPFVRRNSSGRWPSMRRRPRRCSPKSRTRTNGFEKHWNVSRTRTRNSQQKQFGGPNGIRTRVSGPPRALSIRLASCMMWTQHLTSRNSHSSGILVPSSFRQERAVDSRRSRRPPVVGSDGGSLRGHDSVRVVRPKLVYYAQDPAGSGIEESPRVKTRTF